MSSSTFLPESDLEKSFWLNNLAGKIQNYASTLGIAAGTITQIQNDAKNFAYILQVVESFRKYSTQLTAFKNILRSGAKDGQPLGALPAAPATPILPATGLADIFGRVGKLVQTIKNSPNFTENIGKDLDIIGSEVLESILAEIAKPILKIELQSGHPNVMWKKGKMGGIKIMVDRGTGKYEFLAIDTQPNYLDTYPLPEMGKSAVWKYVAIYLKSDEEVGDWSDEAQVAVSGRP